LAPINGVMSLHPRVEDVLKLPVYVFENRPEPHQHLVIGFHVEGNLE
jgi:hypothetical protein